MVAEEKYTLRLERAKRSNVVSELTPAETERQIHRSQAAWSTLPSGLSVDVEDYYHVEAFGDRITPEMWPQFPCRVAENTRRVLELLELTGARATFFVLGWVAEQEPQLVREILSGGHEVGCHSYRHSPIWRMKPEEFRADTRRARRAIEDAGGQRVVGYRAPTFSLVGSPSGRLRSWRRKVSFTTRAFSPSDTISTACLKHHDFRSNGRAATGTYFSRFRCKRFVCWVGISPPQVGAIYGSCQCGTPGGRYVGLESTRANR